jgi:hypothetical protein
MVGDTAQDSSEVLVFDAAVVEVDAVDRLVK